MKIVELCELCVMSKAPTEGLTRVDVGSIYKWEKFLTMVTSGHKVYNAKVEYLVSRGQVVSLSVTCLDEPMADYDITESLSSAERERVLDMAVADFERKS